MNDLTDQAIQAALDQKWESAVDLNLSLLEETPDDLASLNRLGFAYMHLGKLSKAKTTYNKVIKLDQYNSIASKCLQKLNKLKPNQPSHQSQTKIVTSFIEEPGKTKTIPLVRPAGNEVLATLSAGTPVQAVNKNKRVVIQTQDRRYIGTLPDDLGFRLNRFINIGYKYTTVIKSTTNASVTIFIKEISRTKKGKNLPSFPNQSTSPSLPKPPVLDETPIDVTPTGEEDSKQAD